MLDSLWSLPPAEPLLSHDEVHVWCAFLDQPLTYVEQLVHTLSTDERARAARFYFTHDRQRFIVCHGFLRMILGSYMSIEPSRLQFCPGPYGKPALAETSASSVPRFNLSHSHQLALYAFARDREVGVDLEYIRPIPEAAQIAERFFSTQERSILQSLPPDEMHKRFFTYWTRMEACLKASGDGLTGLPDQRNASLTSNQPGPDRDAHEATRWSIHDLTPAPGYVGALAVQERDVRIICWQWEP